MNICGIDVETTGFSPVNDRITELGAVLMQLEKQKSFEVSQLCYEPGFPTLSKEVIDVTGLTDEILQASGIPFEQALLKLCDVFQTNGWPDAFLAHNANFDRGMLKAEIQRLRDKIPPTIFEKLLDIPWICSIKDIDHKTIRAKCRVLSHLALEYGIVVDPAKLHRAVDDVHLMLSVVKCANVDFAKLLGRATEPDIIVRAMVPSPFGAKGDGGKGKDKAKECGFGWQKAPGTDGPEFTNSWVKQIKQSEMAQEKEKLGYELTIVKD